MRISNYFKNNTFLLFLYILLIKFEFILVEGNYLSTTKQKKYIITIDKIESGNELYGKIFLGSNNEKIKVLFSIDQSLTFIPSVDCISCQNDDNSTLYQYSTSEDYRINSFDKTLMYNPSIKLNGKYIIDSLTLKRESQNNSCKMPNFRFFLVQEFENLNSSSKNLIGTMGLGLSNLKNPEKYEEDSNLIVQLYKQGMIESPKFSIFISEDNDLDSKLFLGDFSEGTTISSLYKKMAYINIDNSKVNWECELNQIEINAKQIPLYSNIKFSTQSFYIVAPVTDYKIIKRDIFDKLKIECGLGINNQLQCRCDNPNIFSTIKLVISNNIFELPILRIMEYSPFSDLKCNFNILVNFNNFDTWILGTVAMSNSLISYDLESKKVGYFQFHKEANSMMGNENIIIEEKEINSYRIEYFFILFVLIALLFGLYKCANSKHIKFTLRRSDSYAYHNVDNKTMEMINDKFNSEQIDYDIRNSVKGIKKQNSGKYFEMKDIPEDKKPAPS